MAFSDRAWVWLISRACSLLNFPFCDNWSKIWKSNFMGQMFSESIVLFNGEYMYSNFILNNHRRYLIVIKESFQSKIGENVVWTLHENQKKISFHSLSLSQSILRNKGLSVSILKLFNKGIKVNVLLNILEFVAANQMTLLIYVQQTDKVKKERSRPYPVRKEFTVS